MTFTHVTDRQQIATLMGQVVAFEIYGSADLGGKIQYGFIKEYAWLNNRYIPTIQITRLISSEEMPGVTIISVDYFERYGLNVRLVTEEEAEWIRKGISNKTQQFAYTEGIPSNYPIHPDYQRLPEDEVTVLYCNDSKCYIRPYYLPARYNWQQE